VDVNTLQKDTLWYEQLIEKCMQACEDSGTANSTCMKAMEKLLKDMAKKIESLRSTHTVDRHDAYMLLVTRFKSIMEHGGESLLNRLKGLV
jgi:hypothetical protein